MNLVDTIKNAVVPNNAHGEDPVTTGTPQPESDIPGAFPDSDDEQEVEKESQNKLAQGVSSSTRARDSAVDVDSQGLANNKTTTFPDRTRVAPDSSDASDEPPRSRENFGDRGPVLSNESLGLSPDKHEIFREASLARPRESHTGSPGQAGSPVPAGELPELKSSNISATSAPGEEKVNAANQSSTEPEFAMADKGTTAMPVGTHHLGSEGTTPPARSPATGKVNREEGQAIPSSKAATDLSQVAEAPSSSPNVEAESASESLGQYSGNGISGVADGLTQNNSKIPSNGGIRNGVLGRGDSHLGTHLGVAPPPRQPEPEQALETQTYGEIPTGGVHNTVRGHGSGEGEVDGRRPSTASSGSTGKARRANAIHLSGVSDSGLGLGGVHNGVVGHGSHDEESGRHSMSKEGV